MTSRRITARELDFGRLMNRSLANLWLIWPHLLAYLAAVVVLRLAVPLFGGGVSGVAGPLIYFGGQYWLFRAVLGKRRLIQTERVHYFAFVGLALLLILPIILGIAALVVPGIFLVARWIAAPAFIVARGLDPIAASGASQDAVRGQTSIVMSAVVVLILIVMVAGVFLEAIVSGLAGASAFSLDDLVGGHLVPLVLLGLSTATYESLGPEDTTIEEVFG
jgi:hypothetical protein